MAKAKNTSPASARAEGIASEEAQRRIVRANINRTNERSPDFRTIYANDAQVMLTPWDIRLTFGQIVGTPSDANALLVVKEIAEVYMSPQFAKRVMMVLAGQLQHYEQTVGPIPLPGEG